MRPIYANLVSLVSGILLAWVCVSNSSAFCPTPPQEKPYNHISGNIIKIDEPNLFDKVSMSAVRIWVQGSMHFTNADEQGYFFLNEVQNDKIILRFDYLGKSLTLDLGNIGWYQRIEISGIVLANGNVEYANINKFELNPGYAIGVRTETQQVGLD